MIQLVDSFVIYFLVHLISAEIKNIITQHKELRESISQSKRCIRKSEEDIEASKQTLEKWKNQKIKVEDYNCKLQNKMTTQSKMIHSSLHYFDQIGLRLNVEQMDSDNRENVYGKFVLNFTKLIPSQVVKVHIQYGPSSIKSMFILLQNNV